MTDSSVDTLADTVHQTHDVLAERLEHAEHTRPTRERPRDRYSATDPFLASTSRHVAAANAVLAPAARRHLPDGHRRAQEYCRQSKRLEQALGQAKAKLYGSTYAVRRTWDSIWDEVERELAALREVEERLVADLAEVTDEPLRAMIAERLYETEKKVPTRPHPYLPHGGLAGRVARRIALGVDRFWDTAEGRMVPEPVRPRRSREGRMTQYLLADPHWTAPDETSR
jgi:hypothetical protein